MRDRSSSSDYVACTATTESNPETDARGPGRGILVLGIFSLTVTQWPQSGPTVNILHTKTYFKFIVGFIVGFQACYT